MRKTIKYILSIIIVFILFILILAINSANYLLNSWGEVKFAIVLYQLISPLKGTNQDIIEQYCLEAFYPALAIFFIGILYGICSFIYLERYVLRLQETFADVLLL